MPGALVDAGLELGFVVVVVGAAAGSFVEELHPARNASTPNAKSPIGTFRLLRIVGLPTCLLTVPVTVTSCPPSPRTIGRQGSRGLVREHGTYDRRDDVSESAAPVIVRCVSYRLLLVALAVGVLLTACSSASPSQSAVLGRKPLPAGRNPSEIALEVCSDTAQHEITQDLGVTGVVEHRTWVDHLYSCDYVYPGGTFQLSVKELSSWPQTFSYYRGLGSELGDVGYLGNLGQGAFRTANGDVVVRKDWKVLLVDITGLPSQFGDPPTTSADVAYTIADIILACWAGD